MIIAAHTEFPSDRHPMNRDRIDLVDAVQQRECPIRSHFGGHSAREQLDQQRVNTATCLVPQPAQIAMAFREELQHLGVVITCDGTQRLVSQRGDRDRTRVVRVVLLRSP
jgi:hypothetical protein